MQSSAGRILKLCRLQNGLFRMHSKYTQIITTDNRSTSVAWHPQTEFPYERTRPVPELQVEQNTFVLKVQITPEVKEVFKKKTPEQARLELMNITGTTKHRWFPRARDKKAKKTPMDRNYL